MPVLTNPRHEHFAVLVASGLSPSKAYIKAGFSARGARQSAHRLLANPDVSLRVAEVTFESSKRTMDGIVNCRVADVNARLREWQERWEEVRNALDLILGEGGEEMRDLQVGDVPDGWEPHYVAGGSSGFIVRDLKGKKADKPVYRVDSGVMKLYNLLLVIGERAAVELAQWTGKRHFVEDDDIVRPDLSKLNDEEVVIFERLFNKAAPKAPKTSIQ